MTVKHVGFDVDGTFYFQTAELEQLVFDEMKKTIARKKRLPLSEVSRDYDLAYFGLKLKPVSLKNSQTALMFLCRVCGTKTFERAGEQCSEICERARNRYEQKIGRPLASHSKIFSQIYKIDPNEARRVWLRLPVQNFFKKDQKLIAMLEDLVDRKLPRIVYSNNFYNWVANVFQGLGVDPQIYFENIVAGDGSHPKDGSSNGFVHLLRLLGENAKAEEHLFVGDRELYDCAPARRIGMTSARVTWTALEGKPFVRIGEKSYLISSVYEVPKLIDHLSTLE